MGTYNNKICNDYLQSHDPIAMFHEPSLNFEINNHGLRYEIPIDPEACLGATVVGLPDLKFAQDRQSASL
jgi:hypothetical protein